jgi:hypothetical protein
MQYVRTTPALTPSMGARLPVPADFILRLQLFIRFSSFRAEWDPTSPLPSSSSRHSAGSVSTGIRGQGFTHCRKSGAINQVSPTVAEGWTTLKVCRAVPDMLNVLDDHLSIVACRARSNGSEESTATGAEMPRNKTWPCLMVNRIGERVGIDQGIPLWPLR